jgi:hypothetical protein
MEGFCSISLLPSLALSTVHTHRKSKQTVVVAKSIHFVGSHMNSLLSKDIDWYIVAKNQSPDYVPQSRKHRL